MSWDFGIQEKGFRNLGLDYDFSSYALPKCVLLHVHSQYLLSPLGVEGVVLTPRDKVKGGGNRPFLITPGGTAAAKRRRELKHLSLGIKYV